jgi:hypothetical protein
VSSTRATRRTDSLEEKPRENAEIPKKAKKVEES